MTHSNASVTTRAKWIALGAALFLAGCGTSPPENISLPSPGAAATASAGELDVDKIEWKREKPGCRDQCPQIDVESVAFPGDPALTGFVDHALAAMTELDTNVGVPYQTLAEFEPYYWRTARPRDQTVLRAQVLRQTGGLVVLELDSYVFTGGAHGIPATQYINWDRGNSRPLSLGDVLEPGRSDAYVEALTRAHAEWLKTNPDAQDNPTAYNKLWPFMPSANYALGEDGLIVKYDAYSIAPYSHGQPELTIPYAELRGILRPAYLPAN